VDNAVFTIYTIDCNTLVSRDALPKVPAACNAAVTRPPTTMKQPSLKPAAGVGLPSAAERRMEMADIARLAGVSVSTVSRALSGRSLANPETPTRIADLARTLSCSVNLGAQNLRLKQNRTVAVVIPYRLGSTSPIRSSRACSAAWPSAAMLLSRVDVERLGMVEQLHHSGRALGSA
jgi:transcriptional regulator with XRE-family HTH domain